MADPADEVVGFSRVDAKKILEVADSYRPNIVGALGSGAQLYIAIGKTNASIAASAADTGSTIQMYKGAVTIHAVNSSDQRYATSLVVNAFNLAPTGAIASGKLVIMIRESYTNQWFIVWELC